MNTTCVPRSNSLMCFCNHVSSEPVFRLMANLKRLLVSSSVKRRSRMLPWCTDMGSDCSDKEVLSFLSVQFSSDAVAVYANQCLLWMSGQISNHCFHLFQHAHFSSFGFRHIVIILILTELCLIFILSPEIYTEEIHLAHACWAAFVQMVV